MEGEPFINVLSTYYWSASSAPDKTNEAWVVNLYHGGAFHYDAKINSYHVWCVRSIE